MYKKSQNKRLSIDIPLELHKEIKKRALFVNITLRKWVIRAIIEKMKQEDKYQ